MWARYLRALDTRPLVTKALTSGSIMFASDVLSQGIEQVQRDGRVDIGQFSLYRSATRGLMGMVVFGPSMHYWYRGLDRVFRSAVGKVVADQTVYAPCAIAVFFGWTSFFDGQTWEQTRAKYVDYYPDALVTNYKVWPLAQAVTFAFIPGSLRVLFVSGVSLCWNVYLSFVNARATAAALDKIN